MLYFQYLKKIHSGVIIADKQLLKSYIVKYDKSQKNLALAMGISLTRLNAKINETQGAEFRQSEIAFIQHRYNLTPKEIKAIFFSL